MFSGFQECKTALPSEISGISKSSEDDSSNANLTEGRTDNLEEDVILDQVPTFAIHEKSPMHFSPLKPVDSHEASVSDLAEQKTSYVNQKAEAMANGEGELADPTKQNVIARMIEKKGSPVAFEHGKVNYGPESQDCSPRKVI